MPFTSLGLHPGMATTWSLPEVAGHAVARDLLLTGRIVTGQEAVGLGLVSLAAPADEVLGHAIAAAERIAAAAPIATRLTLQAVRDGGHASYERALEWEALAQAVTLASEDLHEDRRRSREAPTDVPRPLTHRRPGSFHLDRSRHPRTHAAFGVSASAIALAIPEAGGETGRATGGEAGGEAGRETRREAVRARRGDDATKP